MEDQEDKRGKKPVGKSMGVILGFSKEERKVIKELAKTRGKPVKMR